MRNIDKFEKNDKVIVISDCRSNGNKGTVLYNYNGFSGKYVMVQLDNGIKQGYKKTSIAKIKDEEDDMNMKKFKNVAIVNLLDDYNKKDYGFAVYDEELEIIKMMRYPVMVVVNAKGKDNRILGMIKKIMSAEKYGKDVTAQIVGVVNMNGYITRIEEENKLKEIAKQKAAIEDELEKEIDKRKSVEYYEEMARKYSDNPRLAELVNQLKELVE